MNRVVVRIILFALVVMAGSSCVRRPKGVKSDSDMVPVVADMAVADAYLRTVSGNTPQERDEVMAYVLSKHGMTRAEYDSTMVWYARNSDAQFEMTEKVIKELEKMHGKARGVTPGVMESNDLWPYSRMAVISPLGVYDGFNFSIPTVDVKKGERLRLKMRFNSTVDGEVLFGLEYDGGRKVFNTSQLHGTRFEMTLQTDTAVKVNRIFANLITDRELQKTVWIDSISLAAMPFDSLMYYQIHSQRRYFDPRPRPRAIETDTADSL